MGGRTAIMVGMVALAVAAPYAAAAYAPAATGGAVVGAAGGGLTATTTSLTLGQSALLAIGNVGFTTSLAAGLAAGSALTGGFSQQQDYSTQGSFDYASSDAFNQANSFNPEERSQDQADFNADFDPNYTGFEGSGSEKNQQSSLLLNNQEQSNTEEDVPFGTFGQVGGFSANNTSSGSTNFKGFDEPSSGFSTAKFGSEFKTFAGSLS